MWIRWLLTRTYCSREKFLSILYRSEICTIVACFCLFGCHSNIFSEKFRWHVWILQTRNPYHIRRNWHCITKATELKSVHFWPFNVYLVAMATPFALLKLLLEYLNSPTSKTLPFTVKISRFLAQNWNRCNFGWRLLKFGCHGSSFQSFKISDNICEFADS